MIELWERRHKSDSAALELVDGIPGVRPPHYSRRRPGSGQVGPPGRKIVLVTPCEQAMWLSHWPDAEKTLDGLDAYRCSVFHREPGAPLASDLIRAAVAFTEAEWGPPPADAWVTWIDTRKVASSNPGFCFKMAGWVLDREWNPARGRRGRIRLRLFAPPIELAEAA